MNSFKSISHRTSLWHELKKRLQSSVASSNSEFVMPARIERGPTDILKALESTIKRDPTAPHYKFHDDPFLVPLSKLQTRTYAMARESGRKTAMWVHKEHADLFQKDLSEPPIKAFLPPVTYEDKSQVSETILLDLISQGNVTDALNVYNLLESDVSNETKQALLEMLCFYNSQHVMMDDLPEERWHQRTPTQTRNSWRDTREISALFDHLTKQDSITTVAAAYNALLCGTAKYFDINKAWELYTECKANNIPLTLEAYNSLIRLVSLFRGGGTKPQELITQFFSEMATAGLHPNVTTLNNALYTATWCQTADMALNFAMKILQEFKKFNIKFSLATYYHILRIYGRERSGTLAEFVDVINAVPEESFPIQDADDISFFRKAMHMASEEFADRYAGERLHRILYTGDNYKFLAGSFSESVYFRGYLLLLLTTGTIQEFFEIYRKLVPHIYIPEPSVVAEILKTLESCTTEVVTEYLPQLWSDIVIFDHLERENVVSLALNLMRTCVLPSDSPLHEIFADAGWTLWKRMEESNERRKQHITLEHITQGDILILLLRAHFVERMSEILKKMMDPNIVQVGVMTHQQINELFETCMMQGYAMEALLLLEYCVKVEHDTVSDMAKKLHECVEVNPILRNKLVNLVGADMLE